MSEQAKAMHIKRQFDAAKGPQMLECECGRSIPIRFLYRCLYCGAWFCQPCAEIHFGKTREQYNSEKAFACSDRQKGAAQ